MTALPDTRTVDAPVYAAETDALLARLGNQDGGIAYDDLVASRVAPPDPEYAGRPDPRARQVDLYLPLRGGPRRVRLYRGGDAERQPLVLWLHGGGFVGGSIADLDTVCAGIAVGAGATVVSLDYRLAPEHPYPAGLHDAYDALQWLSPHGDVIGGDGTVAAGGQSAGAALVAGACLLARDLGGRLPARQILCYPALDFDNDSESHQLFDGVFLTASGAVWMREQYLAGQPVTPYAAPLRAESLTGLPPALVLGAGRDPLRDDARAYVARLRADGVEATHVEYADTMHAFLNFPGVLSAAHDAIALISADLAALSSSPLPHRLSVDGAPRPA
jgi:acetyl esterase